MIAAQKIARKKREEMARTHSAARRKVAKIEPIEEHVPNAWRNITVSIEPLFAAFVNAVLKRQKEKNEKREEIRKDEKKEEKKEERKG